jgi:hypothetical protein
MSDIPKYWFPAKRYGWGWGIPCTWQGWIVLIGYLFLINTGLIIIDLKANLIGYLAYMAVLTAIFVIICWRKGEPPRWRWGRSDNT